MKTVRGMRGAVLLTALLVVGGCGILPVREEPVSLNEALASRDAVRSQTQDVIEVVAGEGLMFEDASGRWDTCDMNATLWQYSADAVLYAESASIEVLDEVQDSVEAETRWRLSTTNQKDRASARGDLDGMSMKLLAYDDKELFGVLLFGPCMPIAEEDQDSLDQGDIGSQDLEVPGLD